VDHRILGPVDILDEEPLSPGGSKQKAYWRSFSSMPAKWYRWIAFRRPLGASSLLRRKAGMSSDLRVAPAQGAESAGGRGAPSYRRPGYLLNVTPGSWTSANQTYQLKRLS
jgi:hypothetical protein